MGYTPPMRALCLLVLLAGCGLDVPQGDGRGTTGGGTTGGTTGTGTTGGNTGSTTTGGTTGTITPRYTLDGQYDGLAGGEASNDPNCQSAAAVYISVGPNATDPNQLFIYANAVWTASGSAPYSETSAWLMTSVADEIVSYCPYGTGHTIGRHLSVQIFLRSSTGDIYGNITTTRYDYCTTQYGKITSCRYAYTAQRR